MRVDRTHVIPATIFVLTTFVRTSSWLLEYGTCSKHVRFRTLVESVEVAMLPTAFTSQQKGRKRRRLARALARGLARVWPELWLGSWLGSGWGQDSGFEGSKIGWKTRFFGKNTIFPENTKKYDFSQNFGISGTGPKKSAEKSIF